MTTTVVNSIFYKNSHLCCFPRFNKIELDVTLNFVVQCKLRLDKAAAKSKFELVRTRIKLGVLYKCLYLQNKKTLKPGKHHYKKPNNISKTDKHEQYNESESEIRRNTSSQSPSVVIVGDSMIKHLDKRRLQRSITSKPHKVRTETYSGANIAAMKHHIKPCLESKPEKIILHVGTNDLCNKEATEIAEGIIEVGQLIKQESRKTEIIISQIVNRTDKAGMTKKITEVNELLEHYCKLNKWALIKHSNIESNHLNSYGLHLNRSGTAMLAKNITSFLNNKPN